MDKEGILGILSSVRAAIVYENHNRFGGLYSAVAEAQAEAGVGIKTVPAAISDRFGVRGRLTDIMSKLSLTPAFVAAKAEKLLDELVE